MNKAMAWKAPFGFAHRGGSDERPENTWAAFEHAVELGYSHLETDVHLSADGQVVAYHDPDLQRATGHPGKIADLTMAQLQAIPSPDGRGIPLMRDLLRRWPEICWNIDAKSDRVTSPLIELIRSEGVSERVIFTSFADRRLEQIRAAGLPHLATACGPRQVTALRIASACRPLIPLLRRRWASASAVQVPPSWFKYIPVVDQRLVRLAHEEGMSVHVWTIDDQAEMRRLIDLEVDGIMTDRPSLLKTVLESRGAWPPRPAE